MTLVMLLTLSAVFTLPALLDLTPTGYEASGTAHVIVFLIALVLLALWGRMLARRNRRRPARRGCVVAASAAAVGAAASAVIAHVDPATRAFIEYLSRRGVPPAAAVTLHNLYAGTSALLTILMAAVFYGAAGGFAVWWGSKTWRPSVAPESQDAVR